uniref:Uncharacterized protein n=1 Tax=Ascaris lumbricoides TaxID=6252 RepID=A0A9J2PZL5_ASCLU
MASQAYQDQPDQTVHKERKEVVIIAPRHDCRQAIKLLSLGSPKAPVIPFYGNDVVNTKPRIDGHPGVIQYEYLCVVIYVPNCIRGETKEECYNKG